jgi:hypothetical protein
MWPGTRSIWLSSQIYVAWPKEHLAQQPNLAADVLPDARSSLLYSNLKEATSIYNLL